MNSVLRLPGYGVLGKGQNWLMVAHQLASAYKSSHFYTEDAGIRIWDGSFTLAREFPCPGLSI